MDAYDGSGFLGRRTFGDEYGEASEEVGLVDGS
jgi:hypothetical protein